MFPSDRSGVNILPTLYVLGEQVLVIGLLQANPSNGILSDGTELCVIKNNVYIAVLLGLGCH